MTGLVALNQMAELRKEYILLSAQILKQTTDKVEILDILGKMKEMIRLLEADLLEIKLVSEN